MRISIFILSLLLAVSSSVNAQALLSRNLVNGRMIEVYDDFTWRYEEEDEFQCVRISKTAEICEFGPEWTLTPINSVNLYLDFYYDDLNSARITPYTVGKNVGVTLDFLSENLKLQIADYNGIDESDINIVATFETEVLGQPARTFVYNIMVNGLRLFLYTTYWVGETDSIEVATQNFDLEMTDIGLERHYNFVSKIRPRQ